MKITLAHGSGGQSTKELIEKIFAASYSNDVLDMMEDSAVVGGSAKIAITTDSFVDVFVSDDGITFERSYVTKTNTAICCHNCGISGRPNGHIRLSDGVYFAYAYGDVWANWPTRFCEVELSLIPQPDLSDAENENLNIPVAFAKEDIFANYVAIVCKPAHYIRSLDDGAFLPEILLAEDCMDTVRLLSGVTFEDYDESVVKFVGTLAIPQGTGETYVTVKYRDMQTQMFIEIY